MIINKALTILVVLLAFGAWNQSDIGYLNGSLVTTLRSEAPKDSSSVSVSLHHSDLRPSLRLNNSSLGFRLSKKEPEKINLIPLIDLGIQYNDELEKTLQVEAYRDQFQEEALRIVRLNFQSDSDENVYPFISDNQGMVLLHPKLAFGDKSLAKRGFIQTMLNMSAGSFKYHISARVSSPPETVVPPSKVSAVPS